ncbi:MAG: hypothetical protein MJY72_05235 [Bacteroidales bacterium]|nr:hypothetical protein [Bacteroidales bacterium]
MKRFLAIFAFALSCVIANAQASNVGAGGTVYGIEKIKVEAEVSRKESTLLYVNQYVPTFGANVFYEKTFNGFSTMVEFSYATGKISNMEMSEEYVYGPWEEAEGLFPNYNSFNLGVYAGWTIFPKKRVQIPLYVGLGYDRVNSDPVKTNQGFVGAKARIKVYVTNSIGLYAAANWKYGRGGYTPEKELTFSISSMRAYAEVGMTFMLPSRRNN